MQITPIPCLTDNYAYIINDNNTKTIGVVDPSEAKPVVAFLKKENLKLNYILNTHHHYDHIGGNIELKKLYNANVIGFVNDKHRIPGIDITLEDNEKWIFGKLPVKILISVSPGVTTGVSSALLLKFIIHKVRSAIKVFKKKILINKIYNFF